MVRVVGGSFVAAIVVFVWGALFWMSPLSDGATADAPDDRAVADQLRSELPESGTYLIPESSGDTEEWQKRQKAGPYAIVHFQRHGVDGMSTSTFVAGFLQQWVTFLLVGFLLFMVVGQLPEWIDRTGFVLTIALALAVWTHVGDAIWFHIPGSWAATMAIFDLVSWLAGGAVLAAFVKPPEDQREEADDSTSPVPPVRGDEPDEDDDEVDDRQEKDEHVRGEPKDEPDTDESADEGTTDDESDEQGADESNSKDSVSDSPAMQSGETVVTPKKDDDDTEDTDDEAPADQNEEEQEQADEEQADEEQADTDEPEDDGWPDPEDVGAADESTEEDEPEEDEPNEDDEDEIPADDEDTTDEDEIAADDDDTTDETSSPANGGEADDDEKDKG